MRKTIMIFGASSFLGSNLVQALAPHYRIVAVFHRTPVEVPGVLSLRCDVLKKDNVNRMVAVFRPDVTIYAAGLSSLAACHENPKLADALNSAGLINVCSSAERFGSKFVFVSSSFVLAGEDVTYSESDTPFPGTVYGAGLASSEFYVQKSCLNYVIFRSCPLYGHAYHPVRKNWFEPIEAQLALGNPVSVDDHVEHGVLDVQILARLLMLAIEKGVTNRLFQVSSRDIMSRYGFARTYCEVFGRDPDLVTKTTWKLPLDEKQFRNKSSDHYRFRMELKNAEEFFGFKLPSVEESLRATKKRLAG